MAVDCDTTPDPASIAAGLTQDAIDVLMRFEPVGATLSLALAHAAGFEAARKADLVNVRVHVPGDTLGWFLTPLGRAVHAALVAREATRA